MSEWQRADLHLHSALSPCADDEMTPNNLVNMAKVLGLAIIAVTDHQAADNVPAVMQVAARTGIICLPGIEVQTKEEVHLLAYFPELAELQSFSREVQAGFSDRRRASVYFGRQLIFDSADQVVGEHPSLLQQSTGLTVEQVWAAVERHGGCCVPAHLDRPAYSLLSQLGFLPKTLPIATVEYTQGYLARHPRWPTMEDPLVITSSDAHSLAQMVTAGTSLLHASLDDPRAICQALRVGDRTRVRSYLAT